MKISGFFLKYNGFERFVIFNDLGFLRRTGEWLIGCFYGSGFYTFVFCKDTVFVDGVGFCGFCFFDFITVFQTSCHLLVFIVVNYGIAGFPVLVFFCNDLYGFGSDV